MKKKIRCVYIDGMENAGKKSVAREIRMFFKNKNMDLQDVIGIDPSKLDLQEVFLQDSTKSFILKENGLLSLFYKDLKEFHGTQYLVDKYQEIIRREQSINQQYGVVNFFLIPEDVETAKSRLGEKDLPSYYENLLGFYKGINQISATQGLDIRLIPFNDFDRIYDIKDKILEILEKEYEI